MSPDPKALAALAAYWRGLAVRAGERASEAACGPLGSGTVIHRQHKEAEIYNRCATHLERVLAGQSAIPSFDDN